MSEFTTLIKVDGVEIESDGETKIRVLDLEFESHNHTLDARKFQSLLMKISKQARNKIKRDFTSLLQEEQ